MTTQNQAVSVQPQKRINEAVKFGVATAVTSLAVSSANAAEITTIAEGLSEEISGVKAIVISLFTAAAVLLVSAI